VIPACDLDRHLVGLSAAGDKPYARESIRREAGDLVRQLLLSRVRQAFVVHIRELFGLGAGCGDDVAPTVSERRGHRPTAHGVEVALA
jgi:hypothetical protein